MIDIKTLISIATGKVQHNYRSGLCPDELQPDSRDPDCPACKILIEAATEHDAMGRRLREAEARVAELEADRAERERQEPVATVERITHGSYHQNVRLTWHRHVKTGQKLYAAPPVTAPVRLKREEFELPEGNGLAHISPTGWIAMKEYARAVETAVLRANGFDIQTQEGK